MSDYQTILTEVSDKVATFRSSGNQADALEGVSAFLATRASAWPLSKVTDYPPTL